ncbi:MAG: beta-aspartyl-peptidase [Inconstantimicrobium porci]|uniref:Isoaspartyl dipeptidase n=1 Tax=Inconstantimicrobium porci TaxID=2652291 RepID=A0A7X2MWJ7_9CLOT|nr:beta-aspartyl-peptidase [Inconstantimicrobium porci]MDD6770119.1 beta-aspartyl-peptidase [Inconstantimicrobium porci]MDY5911447.1 beta-aspartyl-peptidase [Inconstantimicrobium porci]MSR90386.1 beta-aspartyl-peptidase [Inconstantimicrobium porci]
MLTIIRNAEIFSPQKCGKKDIFIAGNKIGKISPSINITSNDIEIANIDAEGLCVLPGFIDSHVHIIGGGGEGGFNTRTPELAFSEFVKAGITTVIGCLGTDNICRDMPSLVAKTKALNEEGITAFCYTGSYEIPVNTITGTPKSDLMLISEIIGVGEVALSDNRSSQPTYEDFVKTVAKSRVGGLLSGKAGVVNVHLGSGERGMEYLYKVIKQTEIPVSQLLPTHVNRSRKLFDEAMNYADIGGYIDATTSSDPKYLEEDELTASMALSLYYKKGFDITHITFSSDGNGSMPLFNEKRQLIGLGICSVKSLFDEVKNAVFNEDIPLEDAIKVITSNTADIFKLNHKGRIEEGKDADLVFVDKKTLEIRTVICRGKILMRDGKVLKYGTFEKI